MLVNKAYLLKLYPNADQRQAFMRFSGSCRWLWNQLVELNEKIYATTGKFVFRYDMQAMLPGMKVATPWLMETPSDALQQVCVFLDRALKRSFRPDASGKKAGFPQFKKHGDGRSFYVANAKMRVEGNRVVLPKVGAVKFRSGRLPEGKIFNATVKLEGDDWYCVVQCEVDIPDVVVEPAAGTVIGMDAGLATLAVMSDGVSVTMTKAEKKARKRVKSLQRQLARRRKGSKNRERTRRKLARAHARQANARRDCRHKASRELVDRASVVVLEDLNVRAMIQSRRFGGAVSEAGMSELRRQIEYKARWAGKTVIIADRFYPSTQTCSCCGSVKEGTERLTLTARTYRCAACGHEMDRDLNAAMNLRRHGLHVLGLTHEDEPNNDVGAGYALHLARGESPVEALSVAAA